MIGPKIFAAIIAVAIGLAVSAALITAGRSIVETVRVARDGEWHKRVAAANDAAETAQQQANERAQQASEALRKVQAVEQSNEALIERATELQRLISELTENPVCIPHNIVKELRR